MYTGRQTLSTGAWSIIYSWLYSKWLSYPFTAATSDTLSTETPPSPFEAWHGFLHYTRVPSGVQGCVGYKDICGFKYCLRIYLGCPDMRPDGASPSPSSKVPNTDRPLTCTAKKSEFEDKHFSNKELFHANGNVNFAVQSWDMWLLLASRLECPTSYGLSSGSPGSARGWGHCCGWLATAGCLITNPQSLLLLACSILAFLCNDSLLCAKSPIRIVLTITLY